MASEARRQQKQLEKLKMQRKKLLQAHYNDLIDEELFAEEQQRIRAEVIAAESTITQTAEEWDDVEAAFDELFDQVSRWGDLIRARK